jgi:hypothetical protein
MEAEYKARLDQLEEQKTLSYDRFEEHGKAFIDVMEDGISELEDEVWVSADEVLEASDRDKPSFQEGSGNRIFTSIYNLLCDAEVMPAFHDSPPYDIHVSSYENEDVIEAWEYVSGGEYERKASVDQRELEEHIDKTEELLEEFEDVKLLGNKKLYKDLPGEYLGGFDSSQSPGPKLFYDFRLKRYS